MRNSPGQTHILALQRRVAILTPEERERALARAAEVGAAQAGRELGIAPGTIRVWRSRAAARADNGGRVDMPGDVSGVDPADTWTAAMMVNQLGQRADAGRAVRDLLQLGQRGAGRLVFGARESLSQQAHQTAKHALATGR